MPFKIDGKAIPSRKTEIALAKWEMYARKLGISPGPKEFRELIQYRGMEHTSSVMLDRVREYICAVHGITEAESGIMTFHEVADILEGDWKAREGLATPACDNKPDTSAARIAGVFRNVPTAGPSMEDAIMAKKKAEADAKKKADAEAAAKRAAAALAASKAAAPMPTTAPVSATAPPAASAWR